MISLPVITIVDDDVSMRDSLQGLLKSAGLSSRAFASGGAFLHSDAPAATDCLLLDVDMPGMSGPEVQRELVSRGHRFPIIFLTAGRDVNVRSRVLNDGAAGFLLKPFDSDELLNMVQSVLEAGGAACQTSGRQILQTQ